MDPHSRAAKKNTSHGNEVLPQDTTNFIQRPCYQRGSPCQDPAGNWTTRRPPDDRKETQTAVACRMVCLLYTSPSPRDHITNQEVCAKIQQAIGPHEDLLTILKRHRLLWYLAKTILQGTVKGGRRQGGQRKRWEDNIREWTGLEFGRYQRAVENREKWKKLVAKSSVVPQRPPRLRDR